MKSKIFFLTIFFFLFFFTPASHSTIVNLYDQDGFKYDVDTQIGAVLYGTGWEAYDTNYFLYVNGQTYNPSGSYTLADGGRSVILPTISMSIWNLNVYREIFVPSSGGNFARFLNVFTNPNQYAVTLNNITLGGNLGSDNQTIVTGSSDGDNLAEPTDNWFTTDDNNNGAGDASLGNVLQGNGASETVDSITQSYTGTTYYFSGGGPAHFPAEGAIRADNFFYSFNNVTIGPNATVSIMIFGIQDSNNTNALSEAIFLSTLPQVALTGLTETEKSQIINFNVPPVPEPSTFLLLGLALLGFFLFFRPALK